MLTFPPTVKVRAVVASHCRTPEVPCPTVTLIASAAVSMVTVSPSAMVTSSAAPGTTPPVHVAVLLQLPPPVPLELMGAAFAEEASTSSEQKNAARARQGNVTGRVVRGLVFVFIRRGLSKTGAFAAGTLVQRAQDAATRDRDQGLQMLA